MKTAASWVQIWRIGEFGSDMIGLAAAIQRDAAEAQREAMLAGWLRTGATYAALFKIPLVTDAAAGAKGEK